MLGFRVESKGCQVVRAIRFIVILQIQSWIAYLVHILILLLQITKKVVIKFVLTSQTNFGQVPSITSCFTIPSILKCFLLYNSKYKVWNKDKREPCLKYIWVN